MTNENTENLVDQIAQIAYEDVRNRNRQYILPSGQQMPSWEGLAPHIQSETRDNARAVLKMVVPALLESGWLPPERSVLLREAVEGGAVQDLHKSLLSSIMIDREISGHTTREGINGYSEGVEHGTISLASRIKTILNGAS